MSDERKNRKKAQHRQKRKLKQRESRREQSARSKPTFVKTDIQREVSYMTQRAQLGDSRLVELGKLVLFSTRTRDAWLLDPEDNFAACVCHDGESQPVRILDAPDTFAIDCPAKFRIEGETFLVVDKTGRVSEINGYPIVEISAACRRVVRTTDKLWTER